MTFIEAIEKLREKLDIPVKLESIAFQEIREFINDQKINDEDILEMMRQLKFTIRKDRNTGSYLVFNRRKGRVYRPHVYKARASRSEQIKLRRGPKQIFPYMDKIPSSPQFERVGSREWKKL